MESSEWTGHSTHLSDTREGNENEFIVQIQGKTNLISAQSLPIDPRKTYRLSGKFRTVPGTKPSNFFFGVIPYDAKGQVILPEEVQAIPGSDTVLLEDAKAGSNTIFIRKNTAWKKGGNHFVAFNTDPSGKYKDLPNRNISKRIESIQDLGNKLKIVLSKPLKKSWRAGTNIRQHGHSYLYIYNTAFSKSVPEEWTTISGPISGEPLFGIKHTRHWWRGTRYARIVLLMNNSGNNSNAAFFQDIRLEEVKK